MRYRLLAFQPDADIPTWQSELTEDEWYSLGAPYGGPDFQRVTWGAVQSLLWANPDLAGLRFYTLRESEEDFMKSFTNARYYQYVRSSTNTGHTDRDGSPVGDETFGIGAQGESVKEPSPTAPDSPRAKAGGPVDSMDVTPRELIKIRLEWQLVDQYNSIVHGCVSDMAPVTTPGVIVNRIRHEWGPVQNGEQVETIFYRLEYLPVHERAPEVAVKADQGKPRMDLVSSVAVEGLARVLSMGATKYGDWNWALGLAWSRPAGALLRHLFAFLRGENLDPESGLPHIDHVQANAMFLSEYFHKKTGTDDRRKP